MDTNFTDADISLFLKLFIELGGGNVVDDSPDKYIRHASDGKLETLTVDGRAIPLATYGTRATDAIIINPFAEGESDSSKNLWFYSSRNVILSSLVIAIMRRLLVIGAESVSKKKDKEVKEEPDNRAIGLLSKHILNIDDKMVKEFDSITKSFKDFIIVYYNKSTRQGEVSCFILNEAQRKAHPSIRVKTWEVFAGLLLDILNVRDLSEFNYTPNTQGIPVLESFTNIYVTIFEHIEDALKLIDRTTTSMGTIRSHLKYLSQYAAKARWCTGPQPAAINPVGMQSPLPVLPGVGMLPMTAANLLPVQTQLPGMLPPMNMGMPVGIPGGIDMPPLVGTQMPNGMPMLQPTLNTPTSTPSGEFANPFNRP